MIRDYSAAIEWEKEFAALMLSPTEREILARLSPDTEYVMGIMAKKKTKKTLPVRKYKPGTASIVPEKPEGWTDNLFATWLRQRTTLARRLVVNEARANPSQFKDADGSVPQLEPLPGTQIYTDRNQVWYDKTAKEREAWLARIKEQEIEDGKRQKERIEKIQREATLGTLSPKLIGLISTRENEGK